MLKFYDQTNFNSNTMKQSSDGLCVSEHSWKYYLCGSDKNSRSVVGKKPVCNDEYAENKW